MKDSLTITVVLTAGESRLNLNTQFSKRCPNPPRRQPTHVRDIFPGARTPRFHTRVGRHALSSLSSSLMMCSARAPPNSARNPSVPLREVKGA